MKCLECGKDYEAYPGQLAYAKKEGSLRGRFCSSRCSTKYFSKKQLAKRIYIKCDLCKKPFYVGKYRRDTKKTKSGLHFCSRSCKDKAQSLNINLLKISHYGDGKYTYRTRTLNDRPYKCEDCGFSEYPILVVHHLDMDRSNNRLVNLKLVCPNCHAIRHYKLRKKKRS